MTKHSTSKFDKIIGETRNCPVIEGTETQSKTYTLKCKGVDVNVTISLCRLFLSEKTTLTGLTSSRIDLHKEIGGCWYLEEADTLIEAANKYCEEHGLKMYHQYNTYPSIRWGVNKI